MLTVHILPRDWCLNEYGMGEKYDAADEVSGVSGRASACSQADPSLSQNPNGFRPGTLKVVKSEAEIFELLKLPAVSAPSCGTLS